MDAEGNLLAHGEEEHRRAEQERQRAEQASAEAERLRQKLLELGIEPD